MLRLGVGDGREEAERGRWLLLRDRLASLQDQLALTSDRSATKRNVKIALEAFLWGGLEQPIFWLYKQSPVPFGSAALLVDA